MRSPLVLALLLLAACDPGVRLGNPCEYSSQCPSPLVCGFGRCRAECLRNRDCALGGLCLLAADGTGTCALADDPDCRSGEPCAAGLACFAGECVNACDTVAQCPSDSVCVPDGEGRARCVPEDRATDGGAPDGGVSDAGVADAGDGDAGTACTGAECARAIVSGGAFTCALTVAGTVWCWGAPVQGDGVTHAACAGDSLPCALSPVPVRIDEGGAPVLLEGVSAIAGGGSSACALLADGAVACWGQGWVGQLGDDAEDGVAAHRVHGVGGTGLLDHVIALHPGGELWIAERDVDPRVVGWGERHDGVLLDGGGTGGVWAPIAIDPPAFEQLAVGGWHACVRTATGVSCWGRNADGQSGGASAVDGSTVLSPMPIEGLDGITTIVAGSRGTCALRGDDVLCWGSEFVLGGGASMPDCYCSRSGVLVDRAFSARYRALFSSPSTDTFFALDDAGRAWCWGRNGGSVCDPAGGYSVGTPFLRTGIPGPIDSIAVGYEHACALVSGEVWCWGSNVYGALGDGTTSATAAIEPARVALGP